MGEVRRIEEAGALAGTELSGHTPTLRLFSLLELIASKDRLFTLQGLVEETGMAKPTLHRMLQQLEGAGLLIRENNGRHYGIGVPAAPHGGKPLAQRQSPRRASRRTA